MDGRPVIPTGDDRDRGVTGVITTGRTLSSGCDSQASSPVPVGAFGSVGTVFATFGAVKTGIG
jgi:hypothetical protein